MLRVKLIHFTSFMNRMSYLQVNDITFGFFPWRSNLKSAAKIYFKKSPSESRSLLWQTYDSPYMYCHSVSHPSKNVSLNPILIISVETLSFLSLALDRFCHNVEQAISPIRGFAFAVSRYTECQRNYSLILFHCHFLGCLCPMSGLWCVDWIKTCSDFWLQSALVKWL